MSGEALIEGNARPCKGATVTLQGRHTWQERRESGSSSPGSAVRATFIQIEEFRGPNPLVTPMAVQAGYATAGGALFWTGLAGEKLLHHALGDSFVIHTAGLAAGDPDQRQARRPLSRPGTGSSRPRN